MKFLLRRIKGFKNKFRYALQPLEVDHLDEQYNAVLRNGHEIKMGIEFDSWGKPVAYHLTTKHPGDGDYMFAGRGYSRIPAEEIIHLFVKERPTQIRGVPWAHTAIISLHNLNGFQEAAIVNGRVGASKGGFFIPPAGDPSDYIGDDKTAEGDVVTEIEPGTFERLPAGWDFKSFTPEFPTAYYAEFMKATLQSISSGLCVSYPSLASDLEGVNFSSIRSGVIEERDMWKMIQKWFIEHCLEIIFEDWLDMALLSGEIKSPIGNPLPYSKFEKFNQPRFRPRGWAWVDPLKDIKANIVAIQAGLKTYADVVGEMGLDVEEVFEKLAAEKELAKSYGLNLEAINFNTITEEEEDAGNKSQE